MPKPSRNGRQRPGDLADTERELTLRHAEAVKTFLKHNNIMAEDVDVIGFHGQTVLHRPDRGTHRADSAMVRCWRARQALAWSMTCGPKTWSMAGRVRRWSRSIMLPWLQTLADVRRPVTFVNIGGISNLTFIGTDGTIIAYDSGPGNALIDQWVEAHAGIPFDQGGMIASEGRILSALGDRYLSNPFFTAPKRRSLDRNDFLPPDGNDASLEDGARTLAHVTAAAILKSAAHLPESTRTFVICGGGRLNRIIMEDLSALATAQDAVAIAAEAVGLNGDTMEAEAWAYLAVRSRAGLPITFPGTTGVRRPTTGGIFAAPVQG